MAPKRGFRRPHAFARWSLLVLCALLLAVWAFTSFRPLHPTWLREEHVLWVGVGHGYVEGYYRVGLLAHHNGLLFPRAMGMKRDWLPRLAHTPLPGTPGVWYAAVPLWIPLGLAGAAAAFFWTRRPRAAEGACTACGYDLTGNVTGRCPECGRPAT